MSANTSKKISVKELEREIRRHNHLYFVEHKPEISDYEFDRLVEQLRELKPDSKVLNEIGSDVATGAKGFKKVTHDVEMLSLDKAYDEKTMQAWAEKFDSEIIVSPKIDGCAVSIKYDSDGKIMQAATRGSGSVGEDITPNVRFVSDVPCQIALKNVEVRGEIYMKLSVFADYKNDFANPRNLAAGAIKQKDPQKTGEYRLSFWAYELLNSDAKDEAGKRRLLEKCRFKVLEWKLIRAAEIQNVFDEYLNRRSEFDYEMDGVVYKVNDVSVQMQLGITQHHPRFAIAYKFQGDSGVTTLKDVEWSVSRTGVVTPIGIVEPVELSGAFVSRVSLHNFGLMQKLGLSRGAKVLMMRRGGVIPNLEQVVESGNGTIEAPDACPSCGSPVELRDDFLFCTKPKECVGAKIGELKHFVQTTEIDGLGDVLLEKLYAEGLVTDVSEFYELRADDLMKLERMGETLATKIVRNIEAKREMTLEVFLRSLGIRELGRHAAKLLADNYGALDKIIAASQEELAAIHSFGDVIAFEVTDGLKKHKHLIDKLLEQVKILPHKKVEKGSGVLQGASFLFTGTMLAMERSAAQKLVEEKGGVIASGVSKTLDYLVVGDGGGAGSKLDKAKKLGQSGAPVKILTEGEFLKMLHDR